MSAHLPNVLSSQSVIYNLEHVVDHLDLSCTPNALADAIDKARGRTLMLNGHYIASGRDVVWGLFWMAMKQAQAANA